MVHWIMKVLEGTELKEQQVFENNIDNHQRTYRMVIQINHPRHQIY